MNRPLWRWWLFCAALWLWWRTRWGWADRLWTWTVLPAWVGDETEGPTGPAPWDEPERVRQFPEVSR